MDSNKFDYDVFVIGGGPGGLSAAKIASSEGLKVGLSDLPVNLHPNQEYGLGGISVNNNCIPKKMLHYAAIMGELKEDQIECGWVVSDNNQHNWQRMIKKVNEFVKRLNFIFEKQLEMHEIDFYNFQAELEDKNTIVLKDNEGNTKKVRAKSIVVNVDSEPIYLPVENCKEVCITSDDLFWLPKAPGKTLIIGAGHVGLESAGFLKGLNYDVDVLYRSKPMSSSDRDMVNRITENMMTLGVKFHKGELKSIERIDSGKIRVKIDITKADEEKEVEEEYDTVVMALGRQPTNKQLISQNLSVNLDKDGYLIVNDNCMTSIDGVYSVGHSNNKFPKTTPLFIKEGALVVKAIIRSKMAMKPIDYQIAPLISFTPLEYARCGYTEEEAVAKFGADNVDIYHTSFKPLEWNFSKSRPANLCYTKVIVLREDLKMIGVHFLGPNAGEVIQGFAIAVRMGFNFASFKDTIGIHPTVAEEIIMLEITKRENPVVEKTGC